MSFLEISKSTYYYVIKSLKKEDKDLELKEEIREIFEKNFKRYGYRRITMEVNKDRDNKVNHKKVKRIMKELGLFAIQGKNGKYHSYKGDNGELKENLLLEKVIDEEKHKTTYKRHFETLKPNEKWTTDVSEFKHKDGKLYLSPILDIFDGSIIAYDISLHPDFYQTKRMIEKAFQSNQNLEGLIFHSDQGWQYQHAYFRNTLKEHGVIQSMSRKGNCYDNCIMETFFGRLKNEMFYGHEKEYESFEDFADAIEQYIDYYNNERIQAKTKWMPPVKYREASMCCA